MAKKNGYSFTIENSNNENQDKNLKYLIKVFEKMHAMLGGSVIIISHQERILNIADRIIVISAGSVKADGVKADILPDLLGTVDTGCRVTAGNDKEDCI